MKKFEPGGVFTVNNHKYMVLYVLEEQNKQFLFCSTTDKKDVKAVVFEYKEVGEEVFVKMEKDKACIQTIMQKVYEIENQNV